MIYDVFNVHTIIFELDKGNQTQVVTTYINDPPFILILKVIQ